MDLLNFYSWTTTSDGTFCSKLYHWHLLKLANMGSVLCIPRLILMLATETSFNSTAPSFEKIFFFAMICSLKCY